MQSVAALPSPHGGLSLLPRCLEPPLAPVDGGAAEPRTPVGEGREAAKQKGGGGETHWLGRSLFLAERKNDETLKRRRVSGQRSALVGTWCYSLLSQSSPLRDVHS
ncbi:hypothetical protein Q5P01_017765 [Channa striata]|uniref:Uncharacterized protein n=1 Tax=Channa striata TaxID=64152 RepID=A0AA88MEB5_CHASR|nr:hypothetical protein Q5P01_017765 [Channa striata]